jgi:hypothetical protein
MSERSAHGRVHDSSTPREAVLAAEQKYESWLKILTGELTSREAAAQAGVDRSTIMMLRKVARGHRGVAGVAAGSAPRCPGGLRGGPAAGGERAAAGHDRGAGHRAGGFAGAGRAEEHDVVAGVDEVEGAEMGDHVSLEGSLVVEVEVLEGLACREAGGPDAELAAVGLAGCDLALEAGGEELLMGPAVGVGSLGEPFECLAQRWRLEGSAQVGDVGDGPLRRGHHATPRARS